MIECNSLEEVRSNIDRIDEEIIKLLAERSHFVREAANFKKNKEEVIAQKRVDQVINKVKKLAGEQGVDVDLVEKMYRLMINHFQAAEMSLISGKKQ